MTQMKKSLAEVETLSCCDKFSPSALFEDWKVVEALVRDRVIVLDQWERVGRPSFVACDNMKGSGPPVRGDGLTGQPDGTGPVR
ncbi:hypothetical protein B0H16DRAFT_1734272 [Mycena metata]|uniref:Uncharacterized protein n=1 Tax=Mycena metata TaxID=1033252 RepID=A0AAD7MRY4_9AGAR|nr:hypothetical protein B0H16DRAFT_1734272 [Mycena metata]